MTWLTKIVLKKRWVTFLVAALVTGVSIWATVTLKMELMPDIELPVTSVITIYPQAKPEEVMNKVTVPIEGAISDIEGLKHVISNSREGSSFVFALFDYGTDMDRVNSIISKNLSKLSFPREVREVPNTVPQVEENPQLFAVNMNMMPVVSLSLSGDVPRGELQEIAISKIIPRLETIEGVYHVGIGGIGEDKVLVSPDIGKMNEFGISMSQIASVLVTQEYMSLNQVENTPIRTDALLLKDIARINLGPAPGAAISRTNGKPSVSITVMKDAEANTVSVANAVLDEAEKIKTNLGEELELLLVLDQSEFVEKSISDLVRSAIIGGILAIMVVFLFLMAFRASMVTAISIPLSILIGFLAMRVWGITINILTLSAMVIVVGRVIDNSIVVLEVIFRRMQSGEGFRDAAVGGVKEVAAPITSATLATVVIFIPLAFVGGIVGELFIPFALTITFAMVASLLVALMVVPPLSNFPLSRKVKTKRGDPWYQRAYIRVLKWSLGHRAAILAIAAGLFISSIALLPIIGTAFIPAMGEKMLTIDIEMPPGTDLLTTQETAIEVEEVLAGRPGVLIYETTVGSPSSLGGGFNPMLAGGASTASITVSFTDDVDLEEEATQLREAFEEIAKESTITVSTGEAMATQMMGSDLDVSVRGETWADIALLSDQLSKELRSVDGIVDLEVDLASVEPKLYIKPDTQKLMASGLSLEQFEQIGQEFLLIMMGGPVAQANIEGRTYEIFLEGIVHELDSAEKARMLRVGWPQSVALGDIVTVELGEQPTNIQRIDGKLAASITGAITEVNIGVVNQTVQEKIAGLSMPDGAEITMGGTAEMMKETFPSMFIAIVAAIVLAYAVLVVTFRSFLTALIIMVSLPLAAVGALLALLVAGYPLGISGLMGMMMLVGIVLTNAIVLIASVRQLRKKGLSVYDSLIEGGRTRLRPILMAALTTMIAMFPLALGLGEGVLMAAELAVVVIGGLFSSTLLTLLIIPVIYNVAEGVRRRISKRTV